MGSKNAPPGARLDVRALPTWERHPRIRRAFEMLDVGAALTVRTDHEPLPLRLELERSYPEQFVWVQCQLGIARWEVELRRIARAEHPNLAAFLRRCPLLCDAPEAALAALEDAADQRSYEHGAIVVEQDARFPYLGLLRAGTLAAITTASSGREQRLYGVLPCETFCDAETLDGGRSIARIVATSQARVVLLPAAIVLSAIAQHVSIGRSLATILAQRTRSLAERLSDRTAQPAIVRVASAILPYARPDAGLAPSLEPLRHMTQAQVASIAGTVNEVAARAIAQLETAGALERSRGRIARIDREKLQAFVA